MLNGEYNSYFHAISVPDLQQFVCSTGKKHPRIQWIPLYSLHTMFVLIRVRATDIANCFCGVLYFPRMV